MTVKVELCVYHLCPIRTLNNFGAMDEMNVTHKLKQQGVMGKIDVMYPIYTIRNLNNVGAIGQEELCSICPIMYLCLNYCAIQSVNL